MGRGQRRRLLGKVRVEGGRLGDRLDQFAVQLLDHRTGTALLGHRHSVPPRDLTEPIQRRRQADLQPDRVRNGPQHRDGPPRPGQIDPVPSGCGRRQRRPAVDGDRRRPDQSLGEFPDGPVVTAGLVGLQRGELRIVGGVRALVAKIPAQLVHPPQAADHEPLQVQLGSDPQVEVLVVGVAMGGERARRRTAVHRLQDRRLDLQEVLGGQRGPQRRHHRRPVAQDAHLLGVHDQIGRAPPDPRLRVAQPAERDRVQGLGRHPPGPHQQRAGAGPRVPADAADDEQVAGVDVAPEGGQTLAQRGRLQHQLQDGPSAGQIGEHHAAVVAQRPDPARAGQRLAVRPHLAHDLHHLDAQCLLGVRCRAQSGRVQCLEVLQPPLGLRTASEHR